MALPYSDAFFVMAFERECTESYWEGHVRAFESFGGVPKRISYDNSKVLVSKIIGAHDRKLSDGFLKLQSPLSVSRALLSVCAVRTRRGGGRGCQICSVKLFRSRASGS